MENEFNLKKNEVLKMSNMESNLFTKDCIRTALLALMADQIFDNITVTAIINKAGVSRGGFYRNYKTKEDVLQEIGEGLFQYILDFMLKHKFQEKPKEWFKDLFQNISDHSEAYLLLIRAQAPKNVVIKFDENRILKELQKDDSVTERYRALAIGKSITEIAVEWFQNGMKESPEEMAEIMIKIFFMNH